MRRESVRGTERVDGVDVDWKEWKMRGLGAMERDFKRMGK